MHVVYYLAYSKSLVIVGFCHHHCHHHPHHCHHHQQQHCFTDEIGQVGQVVSSHHTADIKHTEELSLLATSPVFFAARTVL